MTDRPPSPPTPTALPAISDGEDRITATTPQLVTRLEESFNCSLDEATLEDVLLELDHGAYVEWVTITRDGDYVWDLTDAPDRIADAVATAVVERFEGWLENRTGN
ncbi:hypothetical protein [Natronorubrum halophilum]|uniref:hypothetical protein n=1 Tax=Natronorubrum halophilum TaxID=1702106 RepID=UPI000EF6ED4C|nr:hypothetical protein [Natronorubrum halophilum]